MEPAINITYRDIPSSPYVEAAIRDWILRLGRLSARIQRCEVVIQRPHQHHRHGQRYDVRLELVVGDHVIAVSREPGVEPAHENVYIAIRDAFRAARRQLQDHAQIARGEVKSHASPKLTRSRIRGDTRHDRRVAAGVRFVPNARE